MPYLINIKHYCNVFKNVLIVRLKATIFRRKKKERNYIVITYSLAYCPGPELNLIPGACCAHLFDSFPVCTRPILVVCGLLPGEHNLTSSYHGDNKPTNFLTSPCHHYNKQESSEAYSPTGEAGRYSETCFMRGSAACHQSLWWGQRIKNPFIYCSEGEFFKKCSFERDDQKIFKNGSGSY
jgi:hypothetical protein